MNYLQLQRLTRDNDRKKNKLTQQTTAIDCLQNDLQTQSQMITRQRHQLEQAKKEIKILKRKLQQQQMERERVQSRYLLVLQGLEEELQENKKKYSKLQNKIVPLIDNDTVRLKILNEVQSNHQLEINNFKNTIETLKDEILRLKRQNQISKHVLQNEKMTHQQQLRRLKANKSGEYAQDTINYLNFSMQKQIENKLKSSYQQARKEADYYKEKYFASQKKYQQKMYILDREIGHEPQSFRRK